jgi:hypothetical protein
MSFVRTEASETIVVTLRIKREEHPALWGYVAAMPHGQIGATLRSTLEATVTDQVSSPVAVNTSRRVPRTRRTNGQVRSASAPIEPSKIAVGALPAIPTHLPMPAPAQTQRQPVGEPSGAPPSPRLSFVMPSGDSPTTSEQPTAASHTDRSAVASLLSQFD